MGIIIARIWSENKDKKDSENVITNHLTRLVNKENEAKSLPIE